MMQRTAGRVVEFKMSKLQETYGECVEAAEIHGEEFHVSNALNLSGHPLEIHCAQSRVIYCD